MGDLYRIRVLCTGEYVAHEALGRVFPLDIDVHCQQAVMALRGERLRVLACTRWLMIRQGKWKGLFLRETTPGPLFAAVTAIVAEETYRFLWCPFKAASSRLDASHRIIALWHFIRPVFSASEGFRFCNRFLYTVLNNQYPCGLWRGILRYRAYMSYISFGWLLFSCRYWMCCLPLGCTCMLWYR